MAKKSRRARSKVKYRRNLAEATIKRQPQRFEAVSSESEVPSPIQAATKYQYVLIELRRIGIIAGSMLFVLIVLAFILG